MTTPANPDGQDLPPKGGAASPSDFPLGRSFELGEESLRNKCRLLLEACDPDLLPEAWAAFDRLGLPLEQQTAACVQVLLAAFLEEAVLQASARLARLLGRDESWVARRLEDLARRTLPHKLHAILGGFQFSGELPPAGPGAPGTLLASLPRGMALLLWRAGSQDLMGAVRRLHWWRSRCRTKETRQAADRCLRYLTGNPQIRLVRDSDPSWREERFPFSLFDEGHLLGLIKARVLGSPTLRQLLRHPWDVIAIAVVENSVVTRDSMDEALARPAVKEAILRKLDPGEFLSVLEDPETRAVPDWVEEELLRRFPETRALSPERRWLSWLKTLSLLHGPRVLEHRAEQLLLSETTPGVVRRGVVAWLKKDRLLEIAAAPDCADVAGWVEAELMERFPETRPLSSVDRWIAWLRPEVEKGVETSRKDLFETLVRNRNLPVPVRQQALARLAAAGNGMVLKSLDAESLALLLDGFDFAVMPQGWCLALAIECGDHPAARRAFERVVDARTVRSGLGMGRPAWMVEDCARRLGVTPPLTQSLPPPNPAQPLWIPRLLAVAGTGCTRRESTRFADLVENVGELGELPRETREFLRVLEDAPASTHERYFSSADDPMVPDSLSARLNAPRHFRMKPGWRIDYACRIYHGHHGEERGSFISQVFTRRSDVTFVDAKISNWASQYSEEGTHEGPQDSVPVSFDLEGIDLPNTEEALVELASLLRLPAYTSVNPTTRPEGPMNLRRMPEIVLGEAWSGLTIFEEGEHRGEGEGNWGLVRTARVQAEMVVIWNPFPILGLQTCVIERSERRI